MTAVLFAFLAVAFAGIGGRDQWLVAQLAAQQGRHLGLLLVALATTAISTGGAIWAAQTLGGTVSHRAGLLLAAVALAFAALEMALLRPRPEPQEPTRSLGAAGAVLLASQLSDAARFLLFAIAIATKTPQPALLGGALASLTVVGAGWLGRRDLLELPLQALRRRLWPVPLLVAGWLVWSVFA